jgi:glycine hydroxymethyltransferase
MMGGRGGVILCRQDYGKNIDSAVFPGCQGTSAVNIIAAKALIFKLAAGQGFVNIQKKTLENAVHLATELGNRGYRIVSGGTDNHQVIVDLTAKGLDGSASEKMLESVGIIVNRNVIPQDAKNPGAVSGLRLGTAAISVRGMGKSEIAQIANYIDTTLTNYADSDVLGQVKNDIYDLCKAFPVYKEVV